MSVVRIADRLVGSGQPCFVIAEAGVNHNGVPQLAHELVDAAARAGADAVKFQTFSADRLVTRTAPKADYQRDTTDPAETQHEMLRRLELSPKLHRDLAEHCRDARIMFLSTAFDEASVDLVATAGVPAFKIPSGEITNDALLRYVASKTRPVIMSTGMATLDEVQRAVGVLRGGGATEIALLHCVTAYPAEPATINLRAMCTMAAATGLPVGYSDHTLGRDVAVAAVALGAVIVEKHLTLGRGLDGPDHRSSLEPAEFVELVRGIRAAEAALGHGRKEPAPGERAVADVVRRSLVAAQPIAAGTVLTPDLVAIMRPGTGLPPDMLSAVLGRRVTTPLAAGTPLSLDVLA